MERKKESGLLQTFCINAALEVVSRITYERGLTPRGREIFRRTIFTPLKRAETIYLSKAVDALEGYEIAIMGEEVIPQEGGFILTMNHWKDGPSSGNWNFYVASSLVREYADKEIRWVLEGGETRHPFVAKTVGKLFIQPAHLRVAKSANGIVANGEETARAIRETIAQAGVVAVCPEAKRTRELEKADPTLSVVLLNAARNSVPIVCMSTWSANGCLHAAFGTVDPGSLLVQQRLPKEERRQGIVDAVMKKIAEPMPPELRGAYAV